MAVRFLSLAYNHAHSQLEDQRRCERFHQAQRQRIRGVRINGQSQTGLTPVVVIDDEDGEIYQENTWTDSEGSALDEGLQNNRGM